MGMKESTDFRVKVAGRRSSIIAAQWAFFNYEQMQYRNTQQKYIVDDLYSFWIADGLRRSVLFAVIKCHFKSEKLVVKDVAKDIGYHRNTITKVLQEAQEKDLLLTYDYCPYKPSQRTIDGFTFYTQELLSKDTMTQLTGSVIRLRFGTFNVNIQQEYDPERISLRNKIDE